MCIIQNNHQNRYIYIQTKIGVAKCNEAFGYTFFFVLQVVNNQHQESFIKTVRLCRIRPCLNKNPYINPSQSQKKIKIPVIQNRNP